MSNDISLSLTTVVVPPKKFLVDGEEYELFGADHLSSEDEATVMALFARHSLLSRQLELEEHVERGASLAKRMKNTRMQVITKLTNLPKSVAERLPITQQVKLLEAIQSEVEPDDDGDTPADGTDAEEDETPKETRSPREAAGVGVRPDADDES